jgi:hypothetical protein
MDHPCGPNLGLEMSILAECRLENCETRRTVFEVCSELIF